MMPYAPKEQRKEGLRAVLARVPVPVFKHACYRLMREGFSSRSQIYQQMDLARQAIGMPWADWQDA